jgi:hypothetical protein
VPLQNGLLCKAAVFEQLFCTEETSSEDPERTFSGQENKNRKSKKLYISRKGDL